MAFRKFPPKGYRMDEYPLPHSFTYRLLFGFESAAADTATIIPILKNTDEVGSPETVEVNPRNTNFAEDTGALIHTGSIVPRISLSMDCFLTEAAIAEGVRRANFYWMPIYTSFLEPMNAKDEKTETQIKTILGMQVDTTPQKTSPLYNGIDLKGGDTYPLSTVGMTETLTNAKLTGTANMEGIAWTQTQQDLFWDAKNHYTNRGMLNKITGRMKLETMTDRHNFHYFSNNFTNPTVKRGNPHMFCGIFLYFVLADNENQPLLTSEISDIIHCQFRARIGFDEWNPQFDQTPI